jgi:hypothetical protein
MRVAALATLSLPAADAQSVFDSQLRIAPQFLQYRLNDPVSATVSQFAVPLFVVIPVNERLTFDVGTSLARSRATWEGGESQITGLTDTQVRGNYTLGSDFVVLTAGLNLPTGRSSVTLDQFRAAGLISNDFLAFPISSMGTGLAITLGAAVARPAGDWNIGFGGAIRRSGAYEPFDIPNQSLRFQPGNEYRARVGVDRPVGAGRVAFGLTFSAFGKDDAGGSVYNTGNRVIAQAAYTTVVADKPVTIAGYNMFRGPGSYASGDPAGRENLANIFTSITLDAGGRSVEPTLELRHWHQNVIGTTTVTATTPDRTQTSFLSTFGVRTNVDYAGVRFFPSVGYTVGSLATNDAAGAPAKAGLTGFRAQIAAQVAAGALFGGDR